MCRKSPCLYLPTPHVALAGGFTLSGSGLAGLVITCRLLCAHSALSSPLPKILSFLLYCFDRFCIFTNCDSSEHDKNLEFYVRKPSRSEVYACARKLTHDLARRRSASRAAPDKRKPDPAPLNPVSRILSSILNPQSLNRLELSGIVKLYGYRSLGPCFWISSF